MPDKLAPIRNGDTMDEWRGKINHAIAHLNHMDRVGPPPCGPSPGRPGYTKFFTVEDFKVSQSDGYYRLRVSPREHKLGPTVLVKDFLRKDGDKFSSVLYSYKTYVDGTVVVLTQVAFNGKLIISRE